MSTKVRIYRTPGEDFRALLPVQPAISLGRRAQLLRNNKIIGLENIVAYVRE